LKLLVLLLLLAGCTRDGTARLEAQPGGDTVLTSRIVWPERGGREFRPAMMEGAAGLATSALPAGAGG